MVLDLIESLMAAGNLDSPIDLLLYLWSGVVLPKELVAINSMCIVSTQHVAGLSLQVGLSLEQCQRVMPD